VSAADSANPAGAYQVVRCQPFTILVLDGSSVNTYEFVVGVKSQRSQKITKTEYDFYDFAAV